MGKKFRVEKDDLSQEQWKGHQIRLMVSDGPYFSLRHLKSFDNH